MILLTLLLGTCSITLSFIGDDVFSIRNRYTLSSLCTRNRNTQHCHTTLTIGGDTFRRIIYTGGVCVFSQQAALYPRRLTNALKLLPSDRASHSRILTNANGDV